MRAVGVIQVGGPDRLQVLDLPEPQAGTGEIRIRVYAAAINPTDSWLREGSYAKRNNQSGPPFVPGMDVAGIIDQVGPHQVDVVRGNAGGRWQLGDRVMAIVVPTSTHGGYSEQVVVPAESVALAPSNYDFLASATLPMNGLTARYCLDELALQPGQNIAITGAAGVLGGYLTQLAHQAGLRVIADAAPQDIQRVLAHGADDIVARGDDVSDRIRELVPGGVDALVDAAAMNALVIPAIADGGAMATVRMWRGEPERNITLHSIVVGKYARQQAKLDQLGRQAESGVLSLQVAQTYLPTDAPLAHRRLAAGGRRGGLVLDFSPSSTA